LLHPAKLNDSNRRTKTDADQGIALLRATNGL
jgi:hypothetical protein